MRSDLVFELDVATKHTESLSDEAAELAFELSELDARLERLLAAGLSTIEKLRAGIRREQVPTELLNHHTAITRLHTELGSYEKAAKDQHAVVECYFAATVDVAEAKTRRRRATAKEMA